MKNRRTEAGCRALWAAALVGAALFAQPQPVTITLDQAVQMALDRNHALLAARTTIEQNQAQEITANLRPNPTVFGTWAYLPLSRPEDGWGTYLHDLTEADAGLSYTIERGGKRHRRLQAAKDATGVTRLQVADSERTLTFQVASLFINVQLAESMLELAESNLGSFQRTVDIAGAQLKAGSMSENDYQKIKLQLLQFETDVQQAKLSRVQALADLRQQLGYASVPPDYGVSGRFDYQPLALGLEALQASALRNRPDLQAAGQSVTAASSQFALASANSHQDLTVSSNYSHVNGGNHLTFQFSMPLPVFDRNQGEIARTRLGVSQARHQEEAVRGQVLTDVKDAYEALLMNDRVIRSFRSVYLQVAQKNRDISEYSYRRGSATLLDFLDAERSYRATQLAYRQTLAGYLQALEQLREAVGARSLP